MYLRKDFYGANMDKPRSGWQGRKRSMFNAAGCWRAGEGGGSTAGSRVVGGLAGTVEMLQGAEAWMKTAPSVLPGHRRHGAGRGVRT